MRVVVGSGNARDFRQADLDRHAEMMSRFVGRVQNGTAPSPAATMILRGPGSGPAQALIALRSELSRAGASARVILAKLEPEEDLRELFASLTTLSPQEPSTALIRWARNPRLLDAHEQVIYGDCMCWSGDAMRRDAERRNTLALYEEAAPDTVRLAQLAFAALWDASARVPERRLIGQAAAKPSGAYQRADDPVAVSTRRPSLQPWPLIRH